MVKWPVLLFSWTHSTSIGDCSRTDGIHFFLRWSDRRKRKRVAGRDKKRKRFIKKPRAREDEIVPGLGSYASYWYDLEKRNPVAEASKLSCPLFILQGERDYQVTMVDFNNWKEGSLLGITLRLNFIPG